MQSIEQGNTAYRRQADDASIICRKKMKDDNRATTSQIEQHVTTVLQAEKDAQQAVHDCEGEAKQSITDAQIAAQHIITRTDQRISDMEMRHSHKLNKHIRDIEKQGAEKADAEAGGHLEAEKLASVIIELAIELCPCDADDGPDS